MFGSSLVTFMPKYLGSKLSCWFDASNPSNDGTRFANSTAVATWVDVSGNAASNATQSVAAEKPVYTLNVQNGLPSMNSATTGQHMVVSSSSNLNMQSGIAVIIVCKTTSRAASNLPMRYGQFPPDGFTWDWAINISATTGLASFEGINTLNVTQSSGNGSTNVYGASKIIMGKFDGTNLIIFVNNTQENSTAITGTLKTGTNNNLSLMWGPGGNMWLGDMFEMMVIQGASTAELNLLHRNYLSPKWGITVA